MIRKIGPKKWKIYSEKLDKNGKRKNLGEFDSLEKAQKHLRDIEHVFKPRSKKRSKK